ncbi:hypothetical protein AKJ16_DCAP05652 [Drosera capensis]
MNPRSGSQSIYHFEFHICSVFPFFSSPDATLIRRSAHSRPLSTSAAAPRSPPPSSPSSPETHIPAPGTGPSRSATLFMASVEGLVPITRAFLAQYYEKYPFELAPDVHSVTTDVRSVINELMSSSSLTEGQRILVHEVDHEPPHKIDENMWKNREHIEEVLFLLERSNWPLPLQQLSAPNDSEIAYLLEQLKGKFEKSLKMLEYFQAKNADFVFNTVMSYMPQDFRGTLIRQQRERSERNKKAQVDALVESGGSIRDRYALLWEQQMERRRQLAQLGSATGVYKTLVKYLVGVPQVLLDFIRKINDDEGNKHQLDILIQAAEVYTSEFERFAKFMSEVFANSPFFISADDVGPPNSRWVCCIEMKNIKKLAFRLGEAMRFVALLLREEEVSSVPASNDAVFEVLKEVSSVPASNDANMSNACQSSQVELAVESVNSYIAWDFSLEQGKLRLDIGFSVEYTNGLGKKVLILPYRRCESDQGNFCTLTAGNYKLIWDNSYAAFFSKTLRYKVDCIPPVVEPVEDQL